ncbi:hypothetical protein L2E82_39964 [Cichorium intybus]|uniref:Uncharacterized protein n=1 Tax=Cichorium intybus TaxID=13427 RepID=A0ACB9AKM8_CICIN|nr:hypothetical protein L2E82_39964 [Cichorium intybus]
MLRPKPMHSNVSDSEVDSIHNENFLFQDGITKTSAKFGRRKQTVFRSFSRRRKNHTINFDSQLQIVCFRFATVVALSSPETSLPV